MMRRVLIILVSALGVLMTVRFVSNAQFEPVRQEALHEERIYAYRSWQSTGMKVLSGDLLDIRASGSWSYTPGEYHGPEGHAHYSSPSYYPVGGVPGGTLLGRVGAQGPPFVVGKHTIHRTTAEGMLYLRINDDILSDNDGYVAVEIAVTPEAEATQR